jgi:glutathione S-transferase
MIRLHQLPPLDRTPSLSPFCMKVETYLRMANIPYESTTSVDPRKGPKGKFPWIEADDLRLGDSGAILEHLKARHGDPVDGHLSATERARGHALRRMLEEHFYWAMVYARWFDARHWPRFQAVFFGHLPRPMQPVLGRVARAMMKRTMHAHGIGRHRPDEILAAGKADLDAVAAELGDRPFLFGDAPCSFDAVAHAFLAGVLDVDLDTPLADHARTHPNLVAYAARMRERFYGN